jgi:regulatory factor X, other
MHFSDWISLTVLRTVALSSNSVAASVEPVMQQQFYSLSPLAGHDFSGLDRASNPLMATHTPTTSSMLAVLNDPFTNGLDTAGSAFNPNNYFMETSPTAHGDAFSDFHTSQGGNPFDVATFGQEIGLSTPNDLSPSKEVEHDTAGSKAENVKDETGTA